ncbi:uncharacterized protein LOC128555248 [Mercenaria mercenaria]|uniref:uncharacterized protein LOC128555248 n=1 Tax=Mercenaria mercenaria TaxID=6596 RepID=UPI00234EF232|nr:uncharacterized protein LOC128555248 [Mercenaria mercenaria]
MHHYVIMLFAVLQNRGETEPLYNMGNEPERDPFLDRVFQNQEKKKPYVKGQPLDLFRLHGAVQERGGMEENRGETEPLYNMGNEPERDPFLDRVFQNQEKKKDYVKGQPLDLFRLHGAVQERGGMEENRGGTEPLYNIGNEPERDPFLDRVFQNQEKKSPMLKDSPWIYSDYTGLSKKGVEWKRTAVEQNLYIIWATSRNVTHSLIGCSRIKKKKALC